MGRTERCTSTMTAPLRRAAETRPLGPLKSTARHSVRLEPWPRPADQESPARILGRSRARAASAPHRAGLPVLPPSCPVPCERPMGQRVGEADRAKRRRAACWVRLDAPGRAGRSGTIETVDVMSEIEHRAGQPRSERDATFLERFGARMRLPIIVSAILPLIVAPESHGWVGVVVGIATWLVFLLDYVVHVRHLEHYGRTGLGRFDLFVVIATAPWFLLPGAQAGGVVVLLRLARLARLAMATKGSRRLFDRLGRIAVVAGGVLVTGSLVAYYAEHPAKPEFATIGDALWWGIVTLTTVGYGDIVPKTPTGRWAAVTIMVTGIAVLGVLSGSLASFFRLDSDEKAGPSSDDRTGSSDTPAEEPGDVEQVGDSGSSQMEQAISLLTAEVSALR